MLSVALPYGQATLHLQMPARIVAAVLSPPLLREVPDPAAVTRQAMAEPLGTPPLAALAAPSRSILLLVDDMTRPTTVHLLLPLVLDELRRTAPQASVAILIAADTNRAMSQGEIAAKIGQEIATSYPVYCYNCHDISQLVHLGVPPDSGRLLHSPHVERPAHRTCQHPPAVV